MQAFVAHKLGKDAKGSFIELPQPQITHPEQILIAIHAASINPVDLKILDGSLAALVPVRNFPMIMGNDLAGEVIAVGSQVNNFKVGDKVFARPDKDNIGSFAEYIVLPQQDLAHMPDNLSFSQAASLPLVSLTAWQALVDLGQIKPGMKVLIHAGSGGVGSIAIQLAKHFGAYVATTASAKNAQLLTQLGADEVIDYRSQDFSSILRDYDFVLDTLGGETQLKSVQVLKKGGKLVSIYGPITPSFTKAWGANWIIRIASHLLSHKIRKAVAAKGASYDFLFMHANGQQLATIANLVKSGAIVPVIDRNYDFKQLQDALDYVATGRSKGKVVINIKDNL